MPPVRSHVATPVTEQTAGVVEVTSSKWPNEAKPEFLPFANNVDATNRYDCLLANLSPTEVPKRDAMVLASASASVLPPMKVS